MILMNGSYKFSKLKKYVKNIKIKSGMIKWYQKTNYSNQNFFVLKITSHWCKIIGLEEQL